MPDLVSAEEAGRILRPDDPLSANAVRQRFHRAGIKSRRGYLLSDVIENSKAGSQGDEDGSDGQCGTGDSPSGG